MKTINKRNKHIDRNIIKEIIIAKRQKRKANLSGANLEGANLWTANLERANLREANLWKANLERAKNIYVFIAYDTSKRMVYCVKHTNTWYVKAGCFWGTIKELKDKVLSTHKSKLYLHNIALLEQL